MDSVTLIVLAAGKSSRFGGSPKLLSQIGKNNETLYEVLIRQIKGVIPYHQIHFVFSDHTRKPIMDVVTSKKLEYLTQDCDITFSLQFYSIKREKPWGTADALASCEPYVKNRFLLLNSDDIFDNATFNTIINECEKSKNYIIGFPLGNTLENDKPANRGFVVLEDNKSNLINQIVEKLNIKRSFYSEQELEKIIVSVNLLLLEHTILPLITNKVEEFKRTCLNPKEEEILLPDILNKLIQDKKIELYFKKSQGNWNGITYIEDVNKVRKTLIENKVF
jgi:NDP-sugar pyrophosphorylase family protein